MINLLTLAQDIVKGRRLTRGDDLSFFLTCDLGALCGGANLLREHFIGNKVDLCSIINGRSGCCPEDCKYCAQSAHNSTNCEEYGFLPEKEIVDLCRLNESEGVNRFSIVTSGRALTGRDFDKAIHAFEALRKMCRVHLCASMGLLDEASLRRLVQAGVTTYHCNLETSRRNFPNICTTHTYDQKIDTLKRARAVGLRLCSGGILGLGETWEDRLDMALSLAELAVDSIPLNVLIPIPGTPLEHQPILGENDILRTIAFFRYLNPTAEIRLAAGRACLTRDGEKAFCSGASATITGNMLTTAACATIRSDCAMLKALGRDVTPSYKRDLQSGD